MEGGVTIQEAPYESSQYTEPKEAKLIKNVKASAIKKRNSVCLSSLISGIKEPTLTTNMVNNYVMHIR
jgi:hypothetical protein